VLALSEVANAEGPDEELTQAMDDEVACLRQQMNIFKANLSPPVNTSRKYPSTYSNATPR
jgi:hypothetical protein